MDTPYVSQKGSYFPHGAWRTRGQGAPQLGAVGSMWKPPVRARANLLNVIRSVKKTNKHGMTMGEATTKRLHFHSYPWSKLQALNGILIKPHMIDPPLFQPLPFVSLLREPGAGCLNCFRPALEATDEILKSSIHQKSTRATDCTTLADLCRFDDQAPGQHVWILQLPRQPLQVELS